MNSDGLEPGFFCHNTSCIDEKVEIGIGTKVWHFCHICEGAKIGSETVIGQGAFIGRRVKIGNNVKLQNNVSVFEGVDIEDSVFCGPSVVFTNVINPRAFIERKAEFKPTFVKNGASIGANATIICGVVIGRYSFVGAGSVVTKDIPDFALVRGVPAKQVGWVSKAGTKLNIEFGQEGVATCSDSGVRYKVTEISCSEI